MLGAVVGTTIVQSLPAVWLVGISKLLGSFFAGPVATGTPVYGLLPGIWGTVMVVVVALGLAVPPALGLALLATEFPFGPLTRHVDVLLGTLGGIPPIIYAILGQVLVQTIIRDKFTGQSIGSPQVVTAIVGVGPDRLGVLQTPLGIPNSVLLGAGLIALLIIPYITPLIQDAIRGVPPEYREASLGLGATRWYTTTHVVLPGAIVGIVASVTLGTLRAIGEVEIAFFCIGSALRPMGLPVPLWDVFEQVSPLPAIGAGLMGGIGGENEGGVSGVAGAVASFTGLLLIAIAAVVVVGSNYLQGVLARRSRA
jgi:phosphate transport system permease protein